MIRKSNYEEMVFFQGGEIQIGANTGIPFQGPTFKTFTQPFYLDVHPVTVSMFRQFIEATGYRTDAEKFGNAGVFILSLGQWQLVENANWKFPFGPSGIQAIDDHPVTQVSWYDAMAYCDWAGKRLPAEMGLLPGHLRGRFRHRRHGELADRPQAGAGGMEEV